MKRFISAKLRVVSSWACILLALLAAFRTSMCYGAAQSSQSKWAQLQESSWALAAFLNMFRLFAA